MAASTSSTPSAASFAQLFRRSKFASFDPTIAQIYTTHGGDKARGNWGIKRPLHHKKGKHAQIWAVDSRYAQTEWQGADAPVKWMKSFQELEVMPTIDWQDTQNMIPKWAQKIGAKGVVLWRTDSDFAKDTIPELRRGNAQRIPNLEAMSEHEFKIYLQDISKRRKEFKDFLQARKRSVTDNRTLLELAGTPAHHRTNTVGEYLASVLSQEQAKKGIVQPSPHRVAGLQYQHPSILQTYLNTKAQPGRLLSRKTSTDLDDAFTAGFAGMTPTAVSSRLPARRMQTLMFNEEGPLNADSESNDDFYLSSKHDFRLEPKQFRLGSAPKVVGNAWQNRSSPIAEFSGVRYSAEVVSDDVVTDRRYNTYRPGSREYISALAPVSYASAANSKRIVPSDAASPTRNTTLHETLESRLRRRTSTRDTLNALGGILGF